MPSDVLLAPPVEHQGHLQRLRTDFPYFARTCLKIRTKAGDIQPFILNRSQRHIHEKIEAQQKSRGKVRALIVKARQQGSSTYIEGRYFWRLWRSTKALKAFIMTHHDDATANIFGLTQRFYEFLPAAIKPPTKAASAKELVFADNGCAFSVSTAGGREVGRSDTIQLFHGSEIPSWPNAQSHITSLTPALSDAPETEWIWESTAKGIGNIFHTEAMAAAHGDSEYELIFVPWFWSEEYEKPCPASTPFSAEWMDYGRLHKLTWEQLYWAWDRSRFLGRAKSMSEDVICPDFRQEYPATFLEAFQSSGNSFIPAMSVLQARKANAPDVPIADRILGKGPVIIGIDPAAQRDKLGIIDRCGRVMGDRICEAWLPNSDVEYVGARIANIIHKISPDAVNIDTSEGFGAALYNWLTNRQFGDILNPINFGSSPIGAGPTGDELYANRRAEIWDIMRAWFDTPGGVKIPDDDALHADLTAPEWGPGATRHSPTTHELIIEPKAKIIERLGHSPDLGDAAALTFAIPWLATAQAQNQPKQKRKVGRGGY